MLEPIYTQYSAIFIQMRQMWVEAFQLCSAGVPYEDFYIHLFKVQGNKIKVLDFLHV